MEQTSDIKQVKVSANGGGSMFGYGLNHQTEDLSALFDEDGSLIAKTPNKTQGQGRGLRGGLRETRQALRSYQRKKKGIETSSVPKKTRKHRIVKPIGKPVISNEPPTPTTTTTPTPNDSPGKGMKVSVQIGKGSKGFSQEESKLFSKMKEHSKTNKKKRVRFRLENETMSISPIRDIRRKMRLQMARSRKTHSNRPMNSYLNHSKRTMKLKMVPLKESTQEGKGERELKIPSGLQLSNETPSSLRDDIVQLSGGIRHIRRVQ
jgi:hypothetical protein